MTGLMDRIPPHNTESEQALLGAILLDSNIMNSVAQEIHAEDFYRDAHRWIYDSIVQLHDKGHAVDLVTLKDQMTRSMLRVGGRDEPLLERCGGAGYLLSLTNACANSGNWKQYAETIRRDAVFRSLIAAGTSIAAMGYEADGDVEEAVSEAASMVTDIALDATTEAKTSAQVMKEFMSGLQKPDLNYFTAPNVPFVRFRPGDLAVIAAGPSVGKTATALSWADEWSKTRKVTYFEYEMTEADLMTRLVCTHAGVTWEQIQDRNLSLEEVERVEDASKELSRRQLRIQEVWCPIGTLVAKIRQEAQRGTEVVVLDHLGLIPFSIPTGMNLAKAYGACVTGRLKRLASELRIVIVLLVQLSREGQKDGNFPKLHHLRDSGEIEQDASIVFTLWSERSIEDQPARKVQVRERSEILTSYEMLDTSFTLMRVGVEKNRNGRLGEQYLLYHGATFRYEARDRQRALYPAAAPELFAEHGVN